jgi:sacsin
LQPLFFHLLSNGAFRPLLPAIIQDLKQCQEQPPTQATAKKAVLLLQLLPPDISAEHRKEIMVPDEKYNLLPLDSVCYNDIGVRASLILSNDVHIAHHAIREDLAARLHIVRLGIKFGALKLGGLRRDMGEKPTTTIRNKLRDYTEHQFLTEFVANADDAQATEFGIFIDEYQNVGEGTLSRRMNKFQTCPSLIIHNNATFTAKDFDGICNTSIGGKRERTDSIGQFGSGALTMFHFSEVSRILVDMSTISDFVLPRSSRLCLGIEWCF